MKMEYKDFFNHKLEYRIVNKKAEERENKVRTAKNKYLYDLTLIKIEDIASEIYELVSECNDKYVTNLSCSSKEEEISIFDSEGSICFQISVSSLEMFFNEVNFFCNGSSHKIQSEEDYNKIDEIVEGAINKLAHNVQQKLIRREVEGQ